MRVTLFAVVVLVLSGLLTRSTHIGSGDEPHYLAIAHSLGFDGDLDVANNYGAAEPLIYDGGLEPGAHVRLGVGEIPRPVHDIGLPLLLAPYIRIAVPLTSTLKAHLPMQRLRLTPWTLYRHLLSAFMILFAGVLAVLMFEEFMAAGAKERLALWMAGLVALSPPLMIYGVLLFTELISTLLCLVAFYYLVLASDAKPRNWALAGISAGLLFLVHARNIGLSLAFLILAARDVRRLAWFTVPFSAIVGLRTVINNHLWGTLLLNPHVRAGEWMDSQDTIAIAFGRLVAMLLDQEFGLIPYAPIFLVSLFGVVPVWETRRDLFWTSGLAVGAYLLAVALPITNAHGWSGGWSPAARFMVPIVPLLALFVVAGVPAIPRLVLVPTIVLQLTINAYFWANPKNLWNDADGTAAICSRGGVPICQYLPSFVDNVRP